MNKRIGELAELVGLLGPNSRVGNAHVATEKFAELIVRECADIAGCNAHVSGFSLGDLIKQHFGVEE